MAVQNVIVQNNMPKFQNVDSLFQVVNFTNSIDKANDMLQGYNLINKKEDVVYSIVRYEQPLKLEREVA